MSNQIQPVFTDIEYQLKLLSRIFHNTDFGDEVIHDLEQSIFDQEYLKRIVIYIKDYFNKYKSMPNIGNIRQIATDDTIINESVKKSILSYLEKMFNYKRKVESGELTNDYQHIEETFYAFIKAQKLTQVSNELRDALEMNDTVRVSKLIDKLKDVTEQGIKNDYGTKVFDDIESALEDPTKYMIPTGVACIDRLIGGLPKGDLGLILSGQGVGKTTSLSLLANNIQQMGYNVLQIIFDENKVNDIRRKHITKWTGLNPKTFDNKEMVKAKLKEFRDSKAGTLGELVIKKFISEGVTVPKIRSFILRYQKRFGLKFDVVLIDYMDELESHKDKQYNAWDGEVQVAKALKSLASELDIPIWSAIQAKKEANALKVLDKTHSGGSIAKIKKAQLIIGIGRDPQQLNTKRATITIAKCNYAIAGSVIDDCIFDAEMMVISDGVLSDSKVLDYDEDQLIKNQEDELRKNGTTIIPQEKIEENRKKVSEI